MCFSATASFAAAAVLAPAGVLALTKAKPKERLFAIIPLLFAAQQTFEGIQWLFIRQGEICTPAGYGFLFFAYLVWPILIPMAAYLMEPDASRKREMIGFGIMGTIVSGVLLALTLMSSLQVIVHENGIFYEIGYTAATLGTLAFFYVASVLAAIRSTHYWVAMFGLMLFLSASFSSIIYFETFTSTWCFFSAWLSLIVLAHFYTKKENKKRPDKKALRG